MSDIFIVSEEFADIFINEKSNEEQNKVFDERADLLNRNVENEITE